MFLKEGDYEALRIFCRRACSLIPAHPFVQLKCRIMHLVSNRRQMEG